jgi:hypothetical protein
MLRHDVSSTIVRAKARSLEAVASYRTPTVFQFIFYALLTNAK